MLTLGWLNRCLGMLGALALGAGTAMAQSDWDKVVETAKQESSLVFYNAQTGWPEPVAAAKSFEAKYGIKVKMLEVRGVELMERIRVEVSNGITGGDVVLMGSTGTAPMGRNGLLAPHGGVPNGAKVVRASWTPEEIPVFIINYGVVINTNLVPKGEEPKSWKDLTDPKWKGKILSDEMVFPGGGQSWFAVTLDMYGKEFHDAIAKQNLQYDRNIPGRAPRIARGEFAVSFPFNVQEMPRYKGLPVKAIIPEEGTPYTPVGTAMIKGAKSPNAARLFMNHLISDEVQLSFASIGYPVAIKGLEDKVPEEWKFSVYGKLLGHADIDKQPERLKLAGEIYGRK